MSYEFYITPEEYEQAEQNGISGRALTERVRKLGWDKDRAINTPVRKINDKKHWVELAKSNGICFQTFYWRLHSGLSLEEAATRPLIDLNEARKLSAKKRRKIPIQAVQRAKENGIKYKTLLNRLRKGWTLEEAITTKLMSPAEAARKGRKL